MRFVVKCISSGERAGARPAVVALRSVAEQLAEFFAERFAAQLRGDDLAVGTADQEVGGDALHGVRLGRGRLEPAEVAHLNPLHPLLPDGVDPAVALRIERHGVDFESLLAVFLVVGFQKGDLGHAGAAPRSPEVEQDILVPAVLDDRFERYLASVGILGRDVDVGMAGAHAELAFAGLAQLGQFAALLPALIAAYTASFTSHFLGLEKFAVDIQDTWTVTNLRSMISLIALGLAFGLAGRCFSVLLQEAKKLFGEKISNPLIRIGVMAIPLAALLFVSYGGRYTGLGTNLISASFAGETIYGYDWILKLLFTVFTLAIGFQGGEVTPLFSIGASLGVVLGSILGIPPIICGALGYAAVFGSATNTLIAPILIGLEVFGNRNTLPLILVCILAYLINGNHSIYGAQQKALCRFEE